MDKRRFLRTIGMSGLGLLAGQRLSSARLMRLRKDTVSGKNWMWLRKKKRASKDTWKRLFATARASGIHAVLPELYNSKKALYQSDRHPQGEQWLEELLPIAEAEGLELHAWMWMMPCNQERIWSDHPEWFSVNRKGESSWESPAYVDYYSFLCPSRPEVHAFLRANILEVASVNGVAGIHLDYIRYPDVILARHFQKKYGIVQDKEYPEYDYCYCDVCRHMFTEETGIDPLDLDDPASNKAWVQFRHDRITTLVNDVLLPAVQRTGKKTSAAVFPNWKSVRQEWSTWEIDAFMPMLYHGFYDEDIDWIGEQTLSGVKAVKGQSPIYAGLFVSHLDPGSLPKAIAAAINGGASGICLFDGGSMSSELWSRLRQELVR